MNAGTGHRLHRRDRAVTASVGGSVSALAVATDRRDGDRHVTRTVTPAVTVTPRLRRRPGPRAGCPGNKKFNCQ